MSDELPDPWGKPAYGGDASAPPPGTPPPRPPAPPTTAMPPTSGTPDPSAMPTSAIPVTRAGGGAAPPREPVPPMGGDLPPPDGRRPLILGIVIGLVAAILVGLIAFALTRDDDDESSELTDVPPATSLPPETVPAPTTLLVEETTTLPTTTTEATTTTVPEPTTTVADPSGWPSGFTLAVAAGDGVRIVGPNGANELVVQESVEIALPVPGTDDFVVQTRSGRASGSPELTAIRRVGPGGAVVLIAPPPGVYLRLHDVRVVAGNPVVLYSTDVGDNPDNQAENLGQYRLGDGTVVDLGQIGGWEAGTSRLKLGGVTAVGEFFAEASSGLLSVREDGTSIDPTSLGLEESYADCGDCPRRFTITPNGQRLAWLDGNSLVVVDLGTGAEVQRAGVPGDLAASVDDIILTDSIAVMNRTAADGSYGNAVIVDLRGAAPVFIDVPIPGFAAR